MLYYHILMQQFFWTYASIAWHCVLLLLRPCCHDWTSLSRFSFNVLEM